MKCEPVIGLANDYTFVDCLKNKINEANILDEKISIIIPFYNRHPELNNTLEALSFQTISTRNMDVIIVDDGSDIAPLNIIDKYKETFLAIRIFSNKRNGFQLAAARNTGMRQALFENI